MQSDIPRSTERQCRESTAQRLEPRLESLTACHFGGTEGGDPGAHPAIWIDAKATPNNLWDTPSHGQKSIEVMVELFLPRIVHNCSRGSDRRQLRTVEIRGHDILAHLPKEEFRTLKFVFNRRPKIILWHVGFRTAILPGQN